MSGVSEVPEALAIAWGLQEESNRGPTRGLTHESIVSAACEIADSDGLAAVTMKRVAESLGFTTMSLYRYVSSKDVLLQLMMDAMIDPEALPDLSDLDWRTGMKQWAHILRDGYRAHPWALEIPRGQISVMMPHSLALADVGISLMQPLHMDDAERLETILAITSLVTSTVSLEMDLVRQPDALVSLSALGELREVVDKKSLPFMGPLMLSGDYVGNESDEGDDGLGFDFGLDRLLDGLAVYAGPA